MGLTALARLGGESAEEGSLEKKDQLLKNVFQTSL